MEHDRLAKGIARAATLLLGAGLMAGGCTPEPAPVSAQPQPNHATFGTDAAVPASAPDAVLRYEDHPRGFAELRIPQGEGPFPLAVIFHGGCWKTGIASQAYMAPLATRWQQLGIATLNVDYREVGDGGGWPGSFEDWAAAAQLIDRVAAGYPIDRARLTLVGHSAGALPAQWLASAQDGAGPVGKRAAVRARSAIVLDGPADVGAEQAAFDALCQFAAVAPFMGGDAGAQPQRYAALDPARSTPQLEEVLFVQAVLPAPPAAAQQAIRAGGARVTVRENQGASHFAIITPGDPIYAANEPAMLAAIRGE